MLSIPLIILLLFVPTILGMLGISFLFPEFKEKKVKNKHN